MKKLIVMCLAAALLIAVFPSRIHAVESDKLSSLSVEGILAFLEEYNVSIPDGYANSDEDLARIVRGWIIATENNPNVVFAYNFAESNYLSNAVKNAVNAHYGNTARVDGITTFSTYRLQQNILWSIPSNPTEYNCYAYALGSSSWKQNPGYFSGTTYGVGTLANLTIATLAGYVVDDLRSDEFGYECIINTTTRPAYDDLASGQTAICIRKGVDDWGNADYHLMRLYSEDEYGDAWRHKPGETYVLQFNYLPSVDVNWICEAYNSSGAFVHPLGMEYSGTIHYIIFAASCDYSMPILVHNYHQGSKHYYQYSKTCENCDETVTYTESVYCNGTSCGGTGALSVE